MVITHSNFKSRFSHSLVILLVYPDFECFLFLLCKSLQNIITKFSYLAVIINIQMMCNLVLDVHTVAFVLN